MNTLTKLKFERDVLREVVVDCLKRGYNVYRRLSYYLKDEKYTETISYVIVEDPKNKLLVSLELRYGAIYVYTSHKPTKEEGSGYGLGYLMDEGKDIDILLKRSIEIYRDKSPRVYRSIEDLKLNLSPWLKSKGNIYQPIKLEEVE